MGKKNKDKKKGKGAERTALRTEKKLANKQKKELKAIGEDDIEKIVADIEKEEQKRVKVTEHQIDAPTRRINFSFVPHPEKDELILFGGEFYNGQKTYVYNDLFFYNIQSNSWTLIKAPASPPPRCGHQMVATAVNKGQLWVFGGEYASLSQSQFSHYRDLWMFDIAKKQWEKIIAPDGPSSRSGHRMVYYKKQLILFGGFHDNLRECKYFNDVYCFNTETYKWAQLEVSGVGPTPRSGCCMLALNDGRILVYGGYFKDRIKKDIDKGLVYTDSFLLTPDRNDTTGLKYKWLPTKLSGIQFSPRCSMPLTTAPNNMAYCFGGVFDIEDGDENLSGHFYNDLISLDMEKLMWRIINVTGKREPRSRRRRNNEADDLDAENVDEDVEAIQERVEATTISDDGIFKVTIGPSSSAQQSTSNLQSAEANTIFQPSPRLNCGLAVKHGVLYLYGGVFEDGDREITYSDFYSLDLKKCEEWKTIMKDNIKLTEWIGSDVSTDEEEDDDDEEESDDDDEEESDDDDKEDNDG